MTSFRTPTRFSLFERKKLFLFSYCRKFSAKDYRRYCPPVLGYIFCVQLISTNEQKQELKFIEFLRNFAQKCLKKNFNLISDKFNHKSNKKLHFLSLLCNLYSLHLFQLLLTFQRTPVEFVLEPQNTNLNSRKNAEIVTRDHFETIDSGIFN